MMQCKKLLCRPCDKSDSIALTRRVVGIVTVAGTACRCNGVNGDCHGGAIEGMGTDEGGAICRCPSGTYRPVGHRDLGRIN